MNIETRLKKLEKKGADGECFVVFGRKPKTDDEIANYRKAFKRGQKMLYVTRKIFDVDGTSANPYKAEYERVKAIIEA